MALKLVIFDWDGTLIDSEQQIVSCMRLAMQDTGLTPPPDYAISNIIGLGLMESMQVLLPEESETVWAAVVERYRYHFLHPDTIPSRTFPGVEQTLQELEEQELLLAVATGKSRRGLERAFGNTGLATYFVTSRCADETRSKPNPQMLDEILAFTGCEADEAVMVGDTEYDLQMAANIGMPSVGVSYGVHEPQRLMDCGPLAMLDCITELPACLSSHGFNLKLAMSES